jgi:hypothetical protein
VYLGCRVRIVDAADRQSFGWFTNIVPLASFYQKYSDPIYHASTIPEPQSVTLFFLILALGAVMDTSHPTTSDRDVCSFINAARQSLALDMSHSVTMVQICYLYVTFVMNGRRDTSGGEVGWPYLRTGMAIAEAIGLHRDPGQWELPEDGATERRIVFWEIHGYDVLQSIALGRGQCIADVSIDCGLPEDGDETLFHRMAYKLTRIWSKINERQIRIAPSPYSDVVDIDEALNEYERSLPHHLSSHIAPSLLDLTDPSRKRLAFRRNMLLMYLAEARMAVHRGWYVRTLRDHPSDPLSSPQSRSFINCLEACRALIALVRNMLALHDQQINKRWHYFFHLFGACACLAACAIRSPLSSFAPVVMAELESGISLFKMAGRDETVSPIAPLRLDSGLALKSRYSWSAWLSWVGTLYATDLGGRMTIPKIWTYSPLDKRCIDLGRLQRICSAPPLSQQSARIEIFPPT